MRATKQSRGGADSRVITEIAAPSPGLEWRMARNDSSDKVEFQRGLITPHQLL